MQTEKREVDISRIVARKLVLNLKEKEYAFSLTFQGKDYDVYHTRFHKMDVTIAVRMEKGTVHIPFVKKRKHLTKAEVVEAMLALETAPTA